MWLSKKSVQAIELHAISGEKSSSSTDESKEHELTLKSLVAFVIALLSTQLLPVLLFVILMIIIVILFALVY